MRLRLATALLLCASLLVSTAPATAAPSGALTQVSGAPVAAAPRRTIGARIKAGVRRLGVFGSAALATTTAAASAYTLHRMGISPAESAVIIGTPIVLGTGALAMMARRAKGVWTRSPAALKLSAVESALARGKHGELPGLVAELQQAIAAAEAGATAGQDPKDAARQVAFLKLALARAQMGIDESDVATVRPNGATLSAWESHVTPLAEAAHAAVTPTSEGKLAIALASLATEIRAEKQVAAQRAAALSGFLDHVPLAFGGPLAAQAKQTQKLLDDRKAKELDPEIALHEKLNTAMRGRVSNRLASEKPEFAQRRDRHGRLQRLRVDHLEGAYHDADYAETELTSAISDRDTEQRLHREAEDHRQDPDPNDPNKTVDNSASYTARAASYASSARTHTDNANASMRRLEDRLRALHRDPTFLAEKLAAMNHHVGQAEAGPSYFEELFGSPTWTGLSSWSAELSAMSQRTRVQGYKRAIAAQHDEVSERENGEHHWLEGQIDGDLSRQMQAAR